MLRVLNLCQNVTLRGSTKLKSLLPFDKSNIGNDHLSTDSGYDNHSCLNFLFHCALNQVDLSTDLLDEVILTKVVIRPTKNPRSIDSHKSVPKKNRNKKKSHLENKKFRIVSKPLYGVSVDPSSDEDNIPQQRLLYTNNSFNFGFLRNAAHERN